MGILICKRMLDCHVQYNKAMVMINNNNKNNDNRTNYVSSCMLFPHVRRLLMACEHCLYQNIRGLWYRLMPVKQHLPPICDAHCSTSRSTETMLTSQGINAVFSNNH